MTWSLRADRLRGVMKEKHLNRKDIIALGYSASTVGDWLYPRPDRRIEPSGPAAVDLSLLMELPMLYLFGAPSRYDDFAEDYRRVVIEGSLNFFLEQTPEGRRVNPDMIPRLREEINSDDPPITAARWKARLDTILRSAEWGRFRDASLNRMVPKDAKVKRTQRRP